MWRSIVSRGIALGGSGPAANVAVGGRGPILSSLLHRALAAPHSASSSSIIAAGAGPTVVSSRTAVVAGGGYGVRFKVDFGDGPVFESYRNPKPDWKGRLVALDRLRPAPDATKRFRELGRGEGTHKGKSAGRGMRGTYHRKRLGKRNFEGGQTPMFRRLPKRGVAVNPMFIPKYKEVTVGQLMYYVEKGRIDARVPIQLKHFMAAGEEPLRDGLKLTGYGAEHVTMPLHVEVSQCDDLARFAIEQAGGSVKLMFMTRIGLKAHLRPQNFDILPNVTNVPPPKKRHLYIGDNPFLPQVLFRSRLGGNAGLDHPLAKWWTPSPVAVRYHKAVELARIKWAAKAGGAPYVDPGKVAAQKAMAAEAAEAAKAAALAEKPAGRRSTARARA